MIILEDKNLHVKLSVKVFETIISWLLGFNFLIAILLFFKGLKIFNMLHKSLTLSSSFVDLVTVLVKNDGELKGLQKLMEIYHIFTIITVIVVAIFIIIRLARREQDKLLKFMYIIMISFIIFANFLIYLTNDLFYALKSINERIYTQELSKVLHLLQKMQNIKDTRYIILITFGITMLLGLVSIIVYIYEVVQKKDEVFFPRLNRFLYLLPIVVFIVLAVSRYTVIKNSSVIKPFDYYILGYDIDEKNNIIPVSYVNNKKIEEKYLDPYIANFLEKGLAFDIQKEDRTLEKNKSMKVSISYNVDQANELGLKIKGITGYVKNKDKPELLKDVKKLNKKSLLHLLKKYEIKYINKNKNDDMCGYYYDTDRNNNIEVFVISKVSTDTIPLKYKLRMQPTNSVFVYQILYLGNVFINQKGDAMGYTAINNENGVLYEGDKQLINEYLKESKISKF